MCYRRVAYVFIISDWLQIADLDDVRVRSVTDPGSTPVYDLHDVG